MKHAAIGLALIFLLALPLGGCLMLEEDEEATELPMRGYGTFKMKVDDPAPDMEIDEGGVATGRLGHYFDYNQDGVEDVFYQIRRPSAGIIGLAFGADGYASGALPVAINQLEPGKTNYAIPLESLTAWIKGDRAIGYRPAKYIDDPNTLVYLNRIFDREEEAPLTGNRTKVVYNLVSMGTLDPTRKADIVDESDETFIDDGYDGDFLPAEFGEKDPRCTAWENHCEKLVECNAFNEADWSQSACTDTIFSYTKIPSGQRYIRCLDECKKSWGCSRYMDCREDCQAENFADAYGCDAEYGPEAHDLVMLVESDGQLFRTNPGYVLQDGERLAVFIDYKDVEGNLGGGKLTVTGAGGKQVFDVPTNLGRRSLGDRTLIGFTIANPVPEGDYTLNMRLQDASECQKEGVPFRVSFSSEGTTVTDNEEEIAGQQQFEMFEIYATEIDKYNVGQGFIDARAMNTYEYEFLYELMEFDVAIVQAYVWSIVGIDQFGSMDIDTLNRSIFTTTQDTKGTKFDQSDDLQAMAFYIDQPMTAGLFTFYGDEGWNIYPIGPYGDNEDQPFMRGDFETTVVKMPFSPFVEVSNEYTGCGDACEYYIDLLYEDQDSFLPEFSTKDDALDHCRQHSADDYWVALFRCLKASDDGNNGCTTFARCLEGVPEPGNGPALCQVAENIPLKMRLTIPSAFLSSDTYASRIAESGRLKVGVFMQSVAGGDLVPGASVDLDPNVTNYEIRLPYMPLVPDRFVQISTAESSAQSQLYIGVVDAVTNEVLGTSYNPPGSDYEDGYWGWLMLYSWNWVAPEQEGWSLGVIAENTIYGFANPYETVVDITFGDLRVLNEGTLKP